jgi:hypothetical protein
MAPGTEMCYLADCTAPGIWQPILNLKSRSNGTITPARFKTIRVCDGHKTSSTVDSFLSSEGYDKLARHLRDAGKSVPQRRLTTLSWEKNPTEETITVSRENPTAASTGETLPSRPPLTERTP